MPPFARPQSEILTTSAGTASELKDELFVSLELQAVARHYELQSIRVQMLFTLQGSSFKTLEA